MATDPTLPPPRLRGMRVLMFVGDIYEDLALLDPRDRLIEEGAEVLLAGLDPAGTVSTGKHGYPIASDAHVKDVDAASFDALVVPGGFMPDKLRRDPTVLDLTRRIFKAGKPVAHICHGGWIPISAGIVRGFTMTSTPGIKDDLVNAGAEWVDREVVVDRIQITSRRPDDLPAFCRAIIAAMESTST
ncbi:MAG: type 1 glutamine amidotransferase domain-containing protein [Planctomycetota bacterium]|nr:type 1 glutamine amidotransferase domain-containing protein [Planctomycetota bacterium]